MSKSRLVSLRRSQPAEPHPQAERARKPRIRLRYVAVIAVCGWAAYHYYFVQRPALQQLQQKQAALQSQLNTMQEKHNDLVVEAREFQDNAYIAKYASQHFNLVLPGQVTFMVH